MHVQTYNTSGHGTDKMRFVAEFMNRILEGKFSTHWEVSSRGLAFEHSDLVDAGWNQSRVVLVTTHS